MITNMVDSFAFHLKIVVISLAIFAANAVNSDLNVSDNHQSTGQSSNGQHSNGQTTNGHSVGLYSIEGRVYPNSDLSQSTAALTQLFINTRIVVNYGEFFAFLKRDGSFEVTNLPPGSYLIEVSNADFFYEPIRVDINSKGKMRARKVNYIQTSAVQQLPYPLKFKAKGPFKYFQVRETWKITDFLLNPMVLMMVLPLLFIMVLPKMMNAADPETQKELQNIQMPKYEVPELSEFVTSLFNGGKQPANVKNKAVKKKQ